MVFSVLTALDLDQKSTQNKFILIEENNTTDGSFVISSILEQRLKQKTKIVFLLFHNSIGHYHAIGKKLGYDLQKEVDSGNVIVYDFLKIICDTIPNSISSLTSEDILKNLFLQMREKIMEFSESSDVMLIAENVGNLLLLGFQLKSAILLSHYWKTLLYDIKNFSVCCSTHNFSENSDSEFFTNNLRYMAHLNVMLNDLEMGGAVDVTGKLTVSWRTKNLMQWDEQSEYHYQLLDRNINVFVPGTKNL